MTEIQTFGYEEILYEKYRDLAKKKGFEKALKAKLKKKIKVNLLATLPKGRKKFRVKRFKKDELVEIFDVVTPKEINL